MRLCKYSFTLRVTLNLHCKSMATLNHSMGIWSLPPPYVWHRRMPDRVPVGEYSPNNSSQESNTSGDSVMAQLRAEDKAPGRQKVNRTLWRCCQPLTCVQRVDQVTHDIEFTLPRHHQWFCFCASVHATPVFWGICQAGHLPLRILQSHARTLPWTQQMFFAFWKHLQKSKASHCFPVSRAVPNTCNCALNVFSVLN